MKVEDFPVEMSPIPGAVPVWRGIVNAEQWRSLAHQVRGKGGRLVALWASEVSGSTQGFEIQMTLTYEIVN